MDKIAQYTEKFNRQDEETQTQYIDNAHAEEFLKKQVPLFECPDREIEEIYYFRWWVYRKHLKKTPEGFIITEFLPRVPWAGAYNSIICACGHHLAEGRWLKDLDREMEDYIRFWLSGSGDEFSYSSWLPYAVFKYAQIKGREELAISLLLELNRFFETVEERNMTRYGLFWSFDDRDAMEMSVSGSGLRPTLNSYMYGNALAIAEIAAWAGDKPMRELYEKKADKLKEKIDSLLWDADEGFYKVIPQDKREDVISAFSFRDIPRERNIRELLGYIPWMFGIPDRGKEKAFCLLKDGGCFGGAYGPSTADRSHRRYRFSYPHECLWNGPSWPFATTQVLDGMIECLQRYGESFVRKQDFMELLKGYAHSHYRIREDGEKVCWLDENLDPDTGEWISRSILKNWGWRADKGGYERGKDYNHSAFCDLVIRGIFGLRAGGKEELILKPLIPGDYWDYFGIREVLYRGHKITVLYDRTGEHFGEKGFAVYVDGRCRVREDMIREVEVQI